MRKSPLIKLTRVRPKTLLQLILIVLEVFLTSTALAAALGFYAANFDPPTRPQLRIVGCALGDKSLPEACKQIAKQISHLVVWVNEDTGKDTLASTRERILMVKKAVEKYGARVEVLASSAGEREARKRALLKDRGIDGIFYFLDADSYRIQKSYRPSDNPRVTWVVFPLETEPALFKLSPATENLVTGNVKEIIEKLGLYQKVDEGLQDLQESLFEEGWKDFLEDLSLACPGTLERDTCAALSSYWKTISILPREHTSVEKLNGSSATTLLVYKPSQSEDRWAEKFTNTALALLRGSESYDKFRPVAEDIAARTLQGYPRGKVPHLRRVSVHEPRGPAQPLTETQQSLGCPAPRGSYHADLDQYVADRFPRAFAKFLKKQLRAGSISPDALYVHNHPIQEAYEFHKRDRYTTFYFLQTRRGQLHRDIHLAVRSHPRSYRVVLTSVRGQDRAVNVLCQVHYNGIFSSYRLVRSKNPQALFVLNSLGSSLELNERDILLFGFRGSWRRMLRAHNWQQRSLVKEGLDIDLFTHPTIPQRLVVARNVYGDDANIVLATFYKKGARHVIYLGIAGAIQNYQIGDVVIPDEFVDRHQKSVPFEKNTAMAYQSELSRLMTVHAGTKHAWAQSLFEETEEVLLNWKDRSVGAVDIEGIYLGRFARQHPDLKIGALFVISDETLGESTIEETNANRERIDDSVGKLVTFLFPKVVNTKKTAD